MNEEKAYWTHEISNVLGVSDGTLRKWCLALEKHGYVFTKGKNNSRAFLVRDKTALLYLKRLIQVEGLTIESASYQVFMEYSTNGRTTLVRVDEGVVRESFVREFENINNRLDEQEEFNKHLLQELKKQQDYIKNSIEKRDRELLNVMNQMQESKKEIAAAREKKWWQFWK